MIFAISIGSNIGKRFENIQNAIKLMKESGIEIIKQSLIYENKALLKEGATIDHNIPYYNMVILCDGVFDDPKVLLDILKNIEIKLGRTDKYNWLPRTIDLDILFYDNVISNDQDLILPHPGIIERPFVLLPMLEVAPYWRHPSTNQTIAQICQINKIDSSPELGFLSVMPSHVRLMQIINLTTDSFSGDGILQNENDHIDIADNLNVIDIGACSTRPGAAPVSENDEIARFDKFLPYLVEKYKQRPIRPEISIDSFRSNVIKHCIESGLPVDIVNDVSGMINIDETLKLIELAKTYNAKFVIMHNLSFPVCNVNIGYEDDVIDALIRFFEEKIEFCLKMGLKKEQIVLDPGIGFSKYQHHSWQIIHEFAKLKERFVALSFMMGYSRKSFMKSVNPFPQKRDFETAGISALLIKDLNGDDYLRVHNTIMHNAILSGLTY